MIGATDNTEAADNFAQNKPSGDENVAINWVNGAALVVVKFKLQKASFQHKMMLNKAVEAKPGKLIGKIK